MPDFRGKNNNAPPHYPHKCQQDKEVSALAQLAKQCRFVKMNAFPSRLQRFSELCENCRVSSHQILTGKIDMSETALEKPVT